MPEDGARKFVEAPDPLAEVMAPYRRSGYIQDYSFENGVLRLTTRVMPGGPHPPEGRQLGADLARSSIRLADLHIHHDCHDPGLLFRDAEAQALVDDDEAVLMVYRDETTTWLVHRSGEERPQRWADLFPDYDLVALRASSTVPLHTRVSPDAKLIGVAPPERIRAATGLITCASCGAAVDAQASSCPECGTPTTPIRMHTRNEHCPYIDFRPLADGRLLIDVAWVGKETRRYILDGVPLEDDS